MFPHQRQIQGLGRVGGSERLAAGLRRDREEETLMNSRAVHREATSKEF